MVSPLPLSIESYLVEAGLTPVELLIIKRLLDEDALTVREIASKSGKSIGSVDQALKRLLQKNIVRKAMLNEQPRYFISSIDSMMKWIEKERMEKKKEEHKRDADFARYLAQIKEEKGKPELEYYSTMEGIHMAYTRLLETGSEILTYTTITPESVLMTPFGHSFTEQRRFKKVMQRFIVPDTCEARKFQSRDYLEFRKTILIPPHEFQYESEESISGDYVLSVNSEKSEATFAKHSKLAQGLRSAFEALWAKQHAQDQVPTTVVIPLQQRLMLALREFFWSRRSVVILSVIGLISSMLTFALYKGHHNANFRHMQQEVLSIAATGAPLFSTSDINSLQKQVDWRRPEWKRVVNQLTTVRNQNDKIFFAYIIRKQKNNPDLMEFVADSHSINPYANTDSDPTNNVDVNHNGKYDSQDILQWPGQPYETAPMDAFRAYHESFATSEFYEDQWGKFVTGYAPIVDKAGKTVAVLAVDMEASKLDVLDAESFSIPFVVIGLSVLLASIWFTAENWLLLKEINYLIRKNVRQIFLIHTKRHPEL